MKFEERMLNIQEVMTTLKLPIINGKDIVEIIILAIICYSIIKALKGTRAWVLMKGISALLVLYAAAYTLKFNVMIIIFKNIVLFLGIALIITVQPELRRMVEKIGTNKIRVSFGEFVQLIRKKRGNSNNERYSDKTTDNIIRSVDTMSKVKTGALIVIEKDIPLNEYIDTGISLNADITHSLLVNIFEVNTPLHDGAIIIRGDKIVSGTCYLPLSDSGRISKDLGTRHRAAIGITEVTDAIVIIVSEETGNVSFVDNSIIYRNISMDELLMRLKQNQPKDGRENGRENRGIHKYITNNFSIKLTSVLVTFIVWVALINSINPVIEKNFANVPVEILNEKIIKELGMTYSVDSEQRVDIAITDRRDVIDSIKSDEIKVIADMKGLSITNSMQLEAYTAKYPRAELKLSRQYINISIEEEVSKEMNVDIVLVGESDGENFISSMEMENETVTVTGAKSVINKIDKAEVQIDQSSLTGSVKETLDIIIYDKNGDRVDLNKIRLNRTKSIVAIELLETKVIDLVVQTKFSNDKVIKYINNIDYSIDKIRIAGTKENLDKINKLNIEVPIELGYEEIIKSEFIKSIDLDKKLLDRELVVADKENKVQITYTFNDKYVTKELIGASNIELLNKKDNLEYDIRVLSNEVILISNNEIVNIPKLTVDVGKLRIGRHEVTVQEIKNGLEIYEKLAVEIGVKTKEN